MRILLFDVFVISVNKAQIVAAAEFWDFYFELTGDGPTKETLAHCRLELMHESWKLLLDNEFMHAYEHGIVIQWSRRVFRRFYPRIFTYSADYPEKYVTVSRLSCAFVLR